MSADSSQGEAPRARALFWSGAGFLLGAWMLFGFLAFVGLLLVLPAPAPPPPPPLDRVEVVRQLAPLLAAPLPASARYARLAALLQQLGRDPRLVDEALRADLAASLRFVQRLSGPREYLVTPRWVEVPAASIPRGARLPVARIEAGREQLVTGAPLPEEPAPSSAPSAPHLVRLRFDGASPARVTWSAGEPLRVRFFIQGLLGTGSALGGEDLERADDAPLPDAGALLLGEPRALARGEGRYFVTLEDAAGGDPLVVPPLLVWVANRAAVPLPR